MTIGVNGQLTYFPLALVAFESENWMLTGFTCIQRRSYFIFPGVEEFPAGHVINKFQNLFRFVRY